MTSKLVSHLHLHGEHGVEKHTLEGEVSVKASQVPNLMEVFSDTKSYTFKSEDLKLLTINLIAE